LLPEPARPFDEVGAGPAPPDGLRFSLLALRRLGTKPPKIFDHDTNRLNGVGDFAFFVMMGFRVLARTRLRRMDHIVLNGTRSAFVIPFNIPFGEMSGLSSPRWMVGPVLLPVVVSRRSSFGPDPRFEWERLRFVLLIEWSVCVGHRAPDALWRR